MDLLKAELERKRKQIEEVNGVKKSKYMKRGDVDKLLEERDKPQSPKRSAIPIKSSSPKRDKKVVVEEEEEELKIPSEEVVKRLRGRGEPTRLFGESDKQRITRLRLLEAKEVKSKGQLNDFKKALESTDTQHLLEAYKKETGMNDETRVSNDELDAIDTTPISLKLYYKEPERNRSLIEVYFTRLLHEWEKYLHERPDEVKQSKQGKLMNATQKQAAEYLKPFFKQLRKGTLLEDVLMRITEIVEFLQQREYQKANDIYLRLSIGNAPWPIGVTAVGTLSVCWSN